MIGGGCQKPISDAFQKICSVEYGIGYEGVFSNYRVFESYAWMHYLYGLSKQKDGRYYDAVIPNYFDPDDFKLADKKEDYLLFIGRVIPRKGVTVALQLAEKVGKRLIVAGQGFVRQDGSKLVFDGLSINSPNVTYVGTVDAEQRSELMSKALAVVVPTQYIGPFEGVHVEAMLCGTPVITTDWGVFTETVIDGFNGYRTRSMGEMIWAVNNVGSLNPNLIRDHAISKWSLDVVRYKYQDYFKQLSTLWEEGWYSTKYDGSDKRRN